MTREDTERIIIAIRFYIARVAWSTGDTERAEYQRLADSLEENLAS